MRRASNDDLLVRAHQKLAFVQMPQGRPVRIPAEWRTRWQACMES